METVSAPRTPDLALLNNKKLEPPTLNLALTLSNSNNPSAPSSASSHLSAPTSASASVSPTSAGFLPDSPSASSFASSVSSAPSSPPSTVISPVSTVASGTDTHQQQQQLQATYAMQNNHTTPAGDTVVPASSAPVTTTATAAPVAAPPSADVISPPQLPVSTAPLNSADATAVAAPATSTTTAEVITLPVLPAATTATATPTTSATTTSATATTAAATPPAPVAPPAPVNVINKLNLPYPPHFHPGSIVWAEKRDGQPPYWPAEVLDLEVTAEGSRLKVRYLGPYHQLSIITGEQAQSAYKDGYLRYTTTQMGGKDWFDSLHEAARLEKEREEAKLKAADAAQNPVAGSGTDAVSSTAPLLSSSLLRSTLNSTPNIGVGSRIRLRSAETIHHKLKEYANTDAEITEVPSHPNTWFGVRLHDGKEIKIRKSAFDVIGTAGSAGEGGGGLGDGVPSIGNMAGLGLGMGLGGFGGLMFPSLLSSGSSSSSSPMGSLAGTPRSMAPFMFPPFTPVPPSPQFLFPQFNTAMNRPLGLRANVRIILTPDTQPFPALVGKEAQVIGVEEGNQYLIKLRDGSTVKLHRMSLAEDEVSMTGMGSMAGMAGMAGMPAMMGMAGLMPGLNPVFNFGLLNASMAGANKPPTVPVPGHAGSSATAPLMVARSESSGGGSSAAGVDGRPHTGDSDMQSEVSNAAVAGSPRETVKSESGEQAMEVDKFQKAEGTDGAGAAGALTSPADPQNAAATDSATGIDAKDGIKNETGAVDAVSADTSAAATNGTSSSTSSVGGSSTSGAADGTQQQQQQQQQLMMQQMQMAQMMAMQQQMYMQMMSHPQYAQQMALAMQQQQVAMPQLPAITPLSMVGSIVSILQGEHTGQTATIKAVNQEAVLLTLKDTETEVVKKFSEISLIQPSAAMQAATAAAGITAAPGTVATDGTALPPGATAASVPSAATIPFPFFPQMFMHGAAAKMRPSMTKQRSLKNLVGKYVQLLSGKYKGEMGVVVKGSNGYFSVRLSRLFNELREHGGIVMKRSGDLKVLNLTEASFELMKQEMKEAEERRAAELKAREKAEKGGEESEEEEEEESSESEDDSDSDSDSSDESSSESDSDEDEDEDEEDEEAKDEKKDSKPATPAISLTKKRTRTSAATTPTAASSTLAIPSALSQPAAKRRAVIVSAPIPTNIKPESLIDSLVVVKKGKQKGQVGTVRSYDKGMYTVEIGGTKGEISKKANDLELVQTGGDGMGSALTPRRLERVGAAVKAVMAKGGEGKGGLSGNLRDAASLLMDLMGEGEGDGEPGNGTAGDTKSDKKKKKAGKKNGVSKAKKTKAVTASKNGSKKRKLDEDGKKAKRVRVKAAVGGKRQGVKKEVDDEEDEEGEEAEAGGADDSSVLSDTSSDSDEEMDGGEAEAGGDSEVGSKRKPSEGLYESEDERHDAAEDADEADEDEDEEEIKLATEKLTKAKPSKQKPAKPATRAKSKAKAAKKGKTKAKAEKKGKMKAEEAEVKVAVGGKRRAAAAS